MNKFILSENWIKLFSIIEVCDNGVFYRIFFTTVKNKIVFIEVKGNCDKQIPLNEGDKIEKAFDWIKSNNVEIIKIKRKK
jgi:hypothetical protein